MQITPSYAALLAILFVILSVRTLTLRRQLKIGLGDHGNLQLLRAVRVHANFAEYVPLALLLSYAVEALAAPSFLVHALGLVLLSARLCHAYGVSQTQENYLFRVTGMAMTFSVMLTASAYILLRTMHLL